MNSVSIRHRSRSCEDKRRKPVSLEILVHETHRQAAEQHEQAAQSHRTAAEHNEKGDGATADWHGQRALEYSDHAYRLAKEAQNKSGKMENL